MRPVLTVTMLAGSEREHRLLRSRLNLFGRRADVHWKYVDEGKADILVLSADNPSLETLALAGRLASVVVIQSRETDHWRWGNDLDPLNHQFLLMLEQWETFLVRRETPLIDDTCCERMEEAAA